MKIFRKKSYIVILAGLLTLITAAAVLFTVPAFGKYTSKISQSFDLLIHPTKPILAVKGTWYRGTTPASEIKMITFVEADYAASHPGLTEEESFVETFYADVKNIGTVQCFVVEDANEEKQLLISGNSYGDSDDIYANWYSGELFKAFTEVTEITGAEKLNTGATTTLAGAFENCIKLARISGIEQWNTGRVYSLGCTFYGCRALTDLDLSGWDTSNVSSLYYTFYNCRALANLDLSGWDTSKVNTMPGVFQDCSSLKSLDLDRWVTDKVSDISHVCDGCSSLTDLNVSGWDTSNVKWIAQTFGFCTSLTTLDLRDWDTSKVTNMSGLFREDSKLQTVYVSGNFVTGTVAEKTFVFFDCRSLTGQHGTSFSEAHESDADYARIDTTNAPGYFCGTTSTITFDPNGGTGSVPAQYVLPGKEDTLVSEGGALTKEHFFFNGWNTEADGSGTAYADCGSITVSEDTVLYAVWTESEATFLSGEEFNIAVKKLAGAAGTVTVETEDSTITVIEKSCVPPEDGTDTVTVSSEDSNRPIVCWLDGTVLKYYTEAEKVYLNADAGSMFRGFAALSSAGTQDYDTGRTSDFGFMFSGSGVTEPDLSAFDTSSAVSMGSMFEDCAFLVSLNVSAFDTSLVTDMGSMFAGCTGLTGLNISNFSTASLTDCSGMFADCTSLAAIYVSRDFDISSLTGTEAAEDMFTGDTVLTGGAGTLYDAAHTDGTYAHIDTNTNPGYFTGSTKKIVFHSNCGTGTSRTQYVLPGTEDALLPNTFTRTGYTFAGWNTAADGTGTAYEDGGTVTRAESDADVLNLYACWQENTYTVTMTLNDGSWTGTAPANPASRLYTAACTLPGASALTRTGYTFGGWYESSAFTGSTVTEIPADTAENKTVYAKWDENTYTVSYNTNGGTFTSAPAESRSYTEKLTLPGAGAISKTGYTFAGWYEASDLSGTAVTAIPENTAEDKTYYAKWTPITYTVRFNSNGGKANDARYIAAITAAYDETFTLPEMGTAFIRSGYSFAGYDRDLSAAVPSYTAGTSLKDLTTVNGATVTLYCIWSYDISVWDSGKAVNAKVKALVSDGAKYTDTDTTIEHFERSLTPPASGVTKTVISRSDSAGKTWVWYDSSDRTVYWYSLSSGIYLGKDSSYLFSGLSALEDIDLSGVSCVSDRIYLASYSTVENISHMFEGCASLAASPLEELDDLSAVTDVSALFKGCASLAAADLTCADFSAAVNMSELFRGCTSLTAVKLTGTEAAEDMHDMFKDCTALQEADFSLSDTADVTNLSGFFSGCTQLAGLDLTGLDTGKVTDMRDLFKNCSALSELNLGSMDTAAVTQSTGLFSGCTALAKVKYSRYFTLKNLLPTPDSTYIPGADGKWYKNDGTGYAVSDLPDHGTFYAVNDFTYATFVQGTSFNAAIKTLAAGTAVTYKQEDSLIKSIVRSDTAPTGELGIDYICVSESAPANDTTGYYDKPIYAWFEAETGILYYYSAADVLFMNAKACNMFQTLTACSSIDLSAIDTSHVTNMGNLFDGSGALQNLDVSGFDTSSVTTMRGMFNRCSALTSLDLSSFDTGNVTTMATMFYDCSGLISLDLSGFDTSKVTDTRHMFNGCSSLKGLDLSSFNTSNVTYMGCMFRRCSSLTELNVSSFDTAQVTNMGGMFYNCSSLAQLDLSNFNTGNVTGMDEMFSGCTALTSLDVSDFDTSNVTNMSYMFVNTTALQSLDLTHWNTSKVTTMRLMFYGSGCPDINMTGIDTSHVTDMFQMFFNMTNAARVSGMETFDTSSCVNMSYMFRNYQGDVSGAEHFDTSKVINMSDMFGGCSQQVSLDLSGWDTGNVTNMGGMFSGCSKLTALDVSGWDTGNVTAMTAMFKGCNELASLDVSHFDTSNATSMCAMFQNCSSLTSLDMSGFNTANITDMSYMFYCCSKLISLDVSNFDTSKVTNMNNMFLNCSSLATIKASSGFSTAAVTNSSNMFAGCTSLVGAAGESYATAFADSTKTDKTYARICLENQPGYFTANPATIYEGSSFNAAVKTLVAGEERTEEDTDSTVTAILRSETAPEEGITTAYVSDAQDITLWMEDTTVYWYSPADITYFPDDCSGMFKGLTALTKIDMDWESDSVDTSSVADVSDMFKGCSAIEDIYFNDFDTSNVTDFSGMFEDCTSLANLGIGDIYTTSAEDMSRMFYGCSALTRLNIWGFDTENVAECTDMFTGAALHEVDVAAGMCGAVQEELYNCKEDNGGHWYTTLDLTQQYTTQLADGDTEEVTEASLMNKGAFYDHSDVTSVQTSSDYFTLNIKNLARIANGLGDAASKYEVDYYITLFRRSMTPAPADAYTLDLGTGSGDITGWYEDGTVWYYTAADQIKTSSCMLFEMKSVRSLDISGFNSSGATGMNQWFQGIAACTRLDTCGFDTHNVTAMVSTLRSCSKLTELDLSGWYMANVTNLWGLFYGSSSLTSLDLSSWNTGKVTNMVFAFAGCSKLESLNVSNWDTSKVTTMEYTFQDCSSLKALDIADWNTCNVTTLKGTFSNCYSLTNLDVSDWNTGNVTTLLATFSNCKALTALDLCNWDTGKVTTLNYTFSCCSVLKTVNISDWDIGNVTSLACMFYVCENLENLDVSGWNTEQVTSMEYAFNNCKKLKSLDVSDWDTGNVTTLKETFKSCSKLTSLDLSDWDTSNVTTLQGTFQSCSGLTSLDISGWDTENVTIMTDTFSGCGALQSLDMSGWNTGKMTSLYRTFMDCASLTEVNVSGWNAEHVTDMGSMFKNCRSLTYLDLSSWEASSVKTMEQAFWNCVSLTVLDLTGWNTASVTNMYRAFDSCGKLKSIYASESFDTSAVTAYTRIFACCDTLTGENGTAYASAYASDLSYARIDDPANDRPGFFSRNATYAVTYWDSDHTAETEEYFLDDYKTGGENAAAVVRSRKLSQTVTLPTEDMMIVPEGMVLSGWLERTDLGWSEEAIYTIAQGERGVYELTPNWVAAPVLSFSMQDGALGMTDPLSALQFGVSGGELYQTETEDQTVAEDAAAAGQTDNTYGTETEE